MRTVAMGVVCACLLTPAIVGVARAQSAPSVLDTIMALKPKAGGASRGIRLPVAAPDAASTSSAAAAPTAGAPTQKLAAFTPGRVPAAPTRTEAPADPRDRNVPFASGSAVVTPVAAKSLESLGLALKSPELQGLKFRVEGHTDTVGKPDANLALSAQRAQAVADYLSATYGVSRDRLQAVGMGEEGLLVPTGAQVAEARNRRVHVETIGE